MNIKFSSIRWRNFLSTGDYDVVVPLDRHKTTLLCGKNGTGKSILTDALCFVLFGKPFRDVNKPMLVNSITRKGLLVEIEFTKGSDEFRVVRGMKPAVFEIYKNGELVDQDSRAKDYQAWLEENVLRTNFKTFCQIVIIGEANFTPFMKLPAGHRRVIIEDLLDISIFSTMNQVVKEHSSRAAEQTKKCVERIGHLENIVETKRSHRAEIARIGKDLIDEKRAEVEALERELREKTEELEAVEVDEEVTARLQEMTETLHKYESAESRLESRRQFLEKRERHFTDMDVCPSCEQKMDEESRVSKLHEISESREDNARKTKHVRDEREKLEKKIARYEERERSNQEARELMTRLGYDVERLRKNIDTTRAAVRDLERKAQERESDDGLERDEEDLAAERKRLRVLRYSAEIYSHALSLLKDTGVKADIISEYVPLINTLINEYLDKLEFFCQFYIDEEFKEHIKSQYRDEFSYSSFSQGQKMRIDLALLFTWREVARLRNSSSFNLLVLDEVMDSSLDDSGTEEFLNLLFGLAEDNNVFIISHKTDKIVDKFDGVMYFDMKQNFTRVMVET